jgi:enoyl-CoA hydratase/carnithine racemase
MSSAAYVDRYENLAFARDSHGVLVLRFHTDGGPVFTRPTHQDFPAALEKLSLDRDRSSGRVWGRSSSRRHGRRSAPRAQRVLQRLLELPMPGVAVTNGPATVHSAYLLLADIHIASEPAT